MIGFRILAAAFMLGLSTLPAFAHAMLRKAVPAVGSTVQALPETIDLLFSEGVEPGFCRVVVHDPAGAVLDTGPPQTTPGGDAKRLIVKLKGSARAGTYSVEWHAVSVDTHVTDGSFHFIVAP